MIVSRTPHRISFFGGGTDYPQYYRDHGGKVLGSAIDKYCYITCRHLPPFFAHKHRIVYSKTEMVTEIGDIQHPSVRETLRFLEVNEGLEIHHDGDIPARSGMGSSSSFTVGLLNSLHALRGKMVSRKELYRAAIHVEQNLIKENVGSQDQVFAACGGLNTIEFLENGEIICTPVILEKESLEHFEGHLMLFFTNLTRFASEIAGEQIRNIKTSKDDLAKMRNLVDEATKVLTGKREQFREFGRLLNETWEIKRGLSAKISNDTVDDIYAKALQNGALGGKLLGAGGGGFILFFVEPDQQARVRESLRGLLQVPFNLDFSGSEIIVYNPDHLSPGRRAR